jgi:hypothetical protein
MIAVAGTLGLRRSAGDIYGMNLAAVAARDTMLLRNVHSIETYRGREGYLCEPNYR